MISLNSYSILFQIIVSSRISLRVDVGFLRLLQHENRDQRWRRNQVKEKFQNKIFIVILIT
jgi:hypothetical protein